MPLLAAEGVLPGAALIFGAEPGFMVVVDPSAEPCAALPVLEPDNEEPGACLLLGPLPDGRLELTPDFPIAEPGAALDLMALVCDPGAAPLIWLPIAEP